jgi:hypothetical protein
VARATESPDEEGDERGGRGECTPTVTPTGSRARPCQKFPRQNRVGFIAGGPQAVAGRSRTVTLRHDRDRQSHPMVALLERSGGALGKSAIIARARVQRPAA